MFKLSRETVSSINEKYSETMKSIEGKEWRINTNRCGCSGDCGSNWMRS
ncbi:hypothetical protein [Proteiniphilum sp. UBA5384]|nr:hypothetical protein [Proteiniphilum sp. UBA5384]